jgi:hypothetical protein
MPQRRNKVTIPGPVAPAPSSLVATWKTIRHNSETMPQYQGRLRLRRVLQSPPGRPCHDDETMPQYQGRLRLRRRALQSPPGSLWRNTACMTSRSG